jgi:hypothetical protein
LRDEYGTVQGKRGIAKWFSLERAMPVLFIVGYIVFLAYQLTPEDVDRIFRSFWAPLQRLLELFT